VLLVEREEAEVEAEGAPEVRELGPRASANEVSLLAVVAKVRKNRTCARLAKRHLHLAELHLARAHDPLLEEGYLRRRQGCNLSLTVLYGIANHVDFLQYRTGTLLEHAAVTCKSLGEVMIRCLESDLSKSPKINWLARTTRQQTV
jgi:hypothetical protein